MQVTTENGANFVKAFRVYGPAENEAVAIDLRNTCKEDEADLMSLWLFSIKTQQKISMNASCLIITDVPLIL